MTQANSGKLEYNDSSNDALSTRENRKQEEMRGIIV